MNAASALAQTTWCPQDASGSNSTNGITIPRGALSVPHFNITSGGGSGGTVKSGTDYYSALKAIEEQMAVQQQQVDSYLSGSDSYDTYDSGGHTASAGDTTPIELSAAQCQHDSTKKLPNGKLPVIPGAGGFGMDTKAGRGGKIMKVTNLNDSGSGSLRACAEASGPRTCVFEVSGTIKLSSNIKITNPYLTIAGQTAPNPGITLRGAGIKVFDTHDILVQHLRVRVGDEPDGPKPLDRDGLSVMAPNDEAYNIVFDHMSVSWTVDKASGTWFDGVHDVSFNNTIFSEPLHHSINPQGDHAFGSLVGDHSKNISFTGNLWAHNYTRNPAFKGDTTSAVINNVMYDAGPWAFMYMQDDFDRGPSQTSIVGNVIKEGPSSDSTHGLIVQDKTNTGSKIYLSDNSYTGEGRMYKNQTGSDLSVSSPPVWPPGYSPLASSDTQEYVLSNAGARPADRDSVDNRAVNDVLNGTGRIIDSQSEVGGWPNLAKNYRVFNVPDNPNGDDDGDGYTNLEEVLHQYAAQVEGCS